MEEWCCVDRSFKVIPPVFGHPEIEEHCKVSRTDLQFYTHMPPILILWRNYEQLGSETVSGQQVHNLLLKGATLTIDEPWTETPVHTCLDVIIKARTVCTPGQVIDIKTLHPEGISWIGTWSFIEKDGDQFVQYDGHSVIEDMDASEVEERLTKNRKNLMKLRDTVRNDDHGEKDMEISSPGTGTANLVADRLSRPVAAFSPVLLNGPAKPALNATTPARNDLPGLVACNRPPPTCSNSRLSPHSSPPPLDLDAAGNDTRTITSTKSEKPVSVIAW